MMENNVELSKKWLFDYSKLHSTGVVSIKETDNTDSELS